MVFLNWKELPWFWRLQPFAFAIAMVVRAAALALVFGWLAFRSRVTGVYFSIITQALSYALLLAFFRNDMGFGGNNGFTDKDILGFDLHSDSTRVVLLSLTAIVLGLAFIACRFIVDSRAGRVTRAIRDAESRGHFLATGSSDTSCGCSCFPQCWPESPGPPCAADRHHQSERIQPDQLDRSGHLGRRRRTRPLFGAVLGAVS
jgi:hypothetical protein